MSAVVEHLHIVRQKRGPPEPIPEAMLLSGRGVPGDHHDRSGIKRAVTLVRAETIEDIARFLGRAVAPGSSRRNFTTRGIDLDALTSGTRLRVGDAELEVVGPCDPCERMEVALGPGALARMEGRGGVVTRIVRDGLVRRGDPIALAAAHGPLFKEHPAPRKEELNRTLLNWFRTAQRDLPWRRTRDPYAVWISEIMCQQTQVATVIPYWERFLERFPTVESLAAASLDDVLARWSGLGYYARARNLHRAAQAVVAEHGGVFPADGEKLLSLPGFGPYTAGAVGSIALGLDLALVDGNVARVLSRIEGWELGAEAAREKAWSVAPGLLPVGRSGDWNQALMELGATVCTPAAPSCDACPARTLCAAARSNDPAQYPLPKERRPRKRLQLTALAARDGQAVLLVRRADSGLFGGLWELPSVVLEEAQDASSAARELAAQAFRKPRGARHAGRVAQALTHRDVEVDVFTTTGTGALTPEGGRWIDPAELATLGLSTLAVKVLVAAGVPVPEGHGRRRAPKAAGQGSLF